MDGEKGLMDLLRIERKGRRARRIDCPNCRRRVRNFILLGPFEFCNIVCAEAYRATFKKSIDNSTRQLDELDKALINRADLQYASFMAGQ